jgi:hypothetical protein
VLGFEQDFALEDGIGIHNVVGGKGTMRAVISVVAKFMISVAEVEGNMRLLR